MLILYAIKAMTELEINLKEDKNMGSLIRAKKKPQKQLRSG